MILVQEMPVLIGLHIPVVESAARRGNLGSGEATVHKDDLGAGDTTSHRTARLPTQKDP